MMKFDQAAVSGLRPGALALGLSILLGCAGMTPEEEEAKRAELDQMGEQTIAALMSSEPDAQEALDSSVGHAVIDMTVTKIPWFGAGGGFGVIVDKRTNTRSYVKVSRFEVGGGLGAQKFKVIIFFSDEKLLDTAITGTWHFDAGAEAVAGTAAAEGGVAQKGEGYRAFKIVQGGAVATVTIRVAVAQPYLQ